MSFFSSLASWFSGQSFSANLAKVAILGYASRLLSDSVSSDSTGQGDAVDPGVRLQLNPSTDTKIPVLYGDAYFGGNITDAAISSDAKTMWFVMALAETTGTKLSDSTATGYTFHDVYLNNNRVVFKSDGYTVDYTVDSSGNQDINMRDLIKVYFYVDGVATQPDGFSGTTPAAHTLISHWNSTDYAMDGLIYAVVEVTYNQSQGVTGLPNCLFRVESDMTLPGDVLYDYMTNSVYGANIPTSELDSSFASLNAYCASGFTYTDSNGTGQTGQVDINGLVDTNTTCLRNMEELAAAANSWMSYDIHNGQWTVVINDTTTTAATITDANLLGEVGITGTTLTQIHNIVDVKYQNTDILDTTDYVKLELPAEDLFDNEPRTTLQLSLPFTNKQAVAAKVGLIALKQARADKIVTFKTDYSFINLTAGEVISLTSASVGFNNNLFRIITVREVESDGVIQCEFTALEYDIDVYNYDITEVAVETDSGILSIGAIGQPDVPVVTNNEQSNLPHVLIEADVPSGIVDTMEFWITYDTTETDDTLRNYVLIGQTYNTNGDSYAENDHVSYRYNTLVSDDFYVKVRGRNALTTGPFSEPTGLIEYVPVVIADTLSDVPVDIGGQIMGLGLLTLLNNLDQLLAVYNGEKGIFDAIKDSFFPSDTTGADTMSDLLLGDEAFTNEFTTVIQGSTTLQNLSDTDTDLALDGDFLVWDDTAGKWVATDVDVSASDIGSHALNELGDVNVPNPNTNDMLVWNGSQWIASPSCCELVDEPEQCYITLQPTLPAPNNMSAPLTDLEINVGANASLGLGAFYIYKSDGTLVDTIDVNTGTITGSTLSLPTSLRAECTWYYVLADEGVIEDCLGCISERICSPTAWQFKTLQELPEVTPSTYDPGYDDPTGYIPPDAPTPPPTITSGPTTCQQTFTGFCGGTITFNQEVEPGPGNIVITGGPTTYTINSCQTNFTGPTTTVTIPNFIAEPGTTYTYTLDDDFAIPTAEPTHDECGNLIPIDALTFTPTSCTTPDLIGPNAGTSAGNGTELGVEAYGQPTAGTGYMKVYDRDTGNLLYTIPADDESVTVDATISEDSFNITSAQDENTATSPYNGETQVNKHRPIIIRFNKPFIPMTGNFYLYKGSTLVQTFDIRSQFSVDNNTTVAVTTDSITLQPTVCMEPGVEYHIRCDANVVVSQCQQPLAAVTDDTVLKFTTISIVTPTITQPSLPDNSSINESGLNLDVPGDLAPGSGLIRVYDQNDVLMDTIDAGDSRVSIA